MINNAHCHTQEVFREEMMGRQAEMDFGGWGRDRTADVRVMNAAL
jgi:hypothetical protein